MKKIQSGLTVLVALVVLMLGVMAIGNPARAEDKEKKRFVDNGDGTITDQRSGKMWEKKTDDGGIHGVNNRYNWTDPTDGDLTNPDGTAFDFIATLNTSPCFVGHCDWRLPEVNRDGGTAELETILLPGAPGSCPGSPNPCIDPIFGPTAASLYWSATTRASGHPIDAWLVNFSNGFFLSVIKDVNDFHVRAVRTGP